MELQAEFFEAIKAGDAESVESKLATNPSLLDSVNEDGIGPIMLASYHRQDGIAQILAGRRDRLDVFEAAALGVEEEAALRIAEAPGAVSGRSPDGFTALHLASFFGRPKLVGLLLRSGGDPDAVAENPSRVRPLHSAAAAPSLEVVTLLLEAGADPNVQQHGGWTPLHAAAMHGDTAMVEALLQHSAALETTSDEGKTAAGLAEEKGHGSIAERLRTFEAKH